MRRRLSAAVLLLTLASPVAQAQSAGAWNVSGAISGRSFELECRLEQPGGVCIDASNKSRVHALTSLSVDGGEARWGFTTKVLIAKIAMRFDGRIEGKRMTGKVTAAGRTGTFTAVRD